MKNKKGRDIRPKLDDRTNKNRMTQNVDHKTKPRDRILPQDQILKMSNICLSYINVILATQNIKRTVVTLLWSQVVNTLFAYFV